MGVAEKRSPTHSQSETDTFERRRKGRDKQNKPRTWKSIQLSGGALNQGFTEGNVAISKYSENITLSYDVIHNFWALLF